MHYFKRNIGDYHKKAGRLSMLQHGAYTLLIDACYDREIFPTEEQAIDWCWACSDAEIEAVKFVLKKFFTLNGETYEQGRIREEIDKYHRNAATNKRIANERETNRKKKDTKRDGSTPNQEPLTKNQSNQRTKFTDDDLALANKMFTMLDDLKIGVKKPNLEKWAGEIRLIRERDDHTLDEITELFTWANNNDFWQGNIRSPAKLRKQWPTLVSQMKRGSAPKFKSERELVALGLEKGIECPAGKSNAEYALIVKNKLGIE